MSNNQQTTPKPRGHWPRGKRRNEPAAWWESTRAKLLGIIEQNAANNRGGISYSGIAHAVSVNPRSVRRWATGEDIPPLETQRKIKQWVAAHA